MNKSLQYFLIISISLVSISSCSIFGSNEPEDDYFMQVPPPQKVQAKDKARPNTKTNASAVAAASAPKTKTTTNRQIIEQRNNGTVQEIKVQNQGDIPDYYIYPNTNKQENLKINNQNIDPPSWQISW